MLVVLHKLPLLLLLSCFLLISFTHASTTLTQGDFDSTVVKGVSFVLFTSPYCSHCRVFAPTWEKLVAQCRISADVQLARVDCSVSGVLCNAHGVVGYPQMNLYRDGAFVEKYGGNRDFSLLVEYLAANAPTETPTLSAPCVDTTAIQSPIKTQDEFNCTVASGLWFIEYLTPWCINCKMFAATWETLLARAQSDVRFAQVDCSSSEDLCRAHGVKGYPHLNLYRDGDFVDTYYGRRDSEMLIASHLFTEYLAAAAPAPPPPVLPPRASTEVRGIDPPPVMELTRDTYRTAMAAPILVVATVGTDTEESVAARLREVALEWSLRYLSGRSVQFVWAKPTSDDGVVHGPLRNVDVFVHIVDHEDGRGAFGTVYLTNWSGLPIKLTASSIFSVLAPLVRTGDQDDQFKFVEGAETEGVWELAMQYLSAGSTFVMAHPQKPLCTLGLLLWVAYLAFRWRCLREESQLRDKKGLLGAM